MNAPADNLAHGYLAALRQYLAVPDERALQQAYEFGRRIIREGLGVMDLAKVHEEAVATVLAEASGPAGAVPMFRHAATFYHECLWVFEMIQRGYNNTSRLLRELNTLLEARARQLSAANEALTKEIARRERIEFDLRATQEDLQRLSGQILKAQEEERKRISRELHDEVGQALTAINVNLAMLGKNASDPDFERRVADMQTLLEQTMETIHSFTRELRPAMLDHLGLIPALRAYVRNFGKRTGLRVRFSSVPEVERLGIEEKTVLYRVTQEGLTNVAKHAQAKQAAVVIRRAERGIRMEVQDNGKSFREEGRGAREKQRLGLLGIQERVRLVKGEFSLTCAPGKGTTIRVEIPLKTGGAKSN